MPGQGIHAKCPSGLMIVGQEERISFSFLSFNSLLRSEDSPHLIELCDSERVKILRENSFSEKGAWKVRESP